MSAVRVKADLVPGVSPDIYSEADFEAIRKIVHEAAGIVLPPSKAMLVYSRIAPLVRATGAGTFSAYIKHIQSDAEACRKTICSLTTNHTFFYREAHHFEHFASTVRPELIDRLNNGESVRIWSAGCSSGEETWSLVMTLLGDDRVAARQILQGDMRILASDIASHAIEAASAATYPAETLQAIPSGLTRAWASVGGQTAQMNADMRGLVRFRHLNLLGDWPMQGQFDVIFCRNVMIYFDQPTKERLVARFAQQLKPNGHLYIGHSERVTGPACDLLSPVGPTIYRKVAA
jgi:chemotaxis protein methyltransferase CheR